MRKTIILLLLLAIATLVLLRHRIGDAIAEEMARRYYRAEIVEAARTVSIDPLFLASLVYVESKFRPDARSPQGAVGLMQLLPATARQVARANKIELGDTAQILEPRMNVLLGALYMRRLLDLFHDTHLAVAAYNGGPGAVREWLRTPAAARDSDVTGFDKAETKRYVQAVDQAYARLRRAHRAWRWMREHIF